MASHYEATLQRDIDLIRLKVLEMSTLDERALKDALQAVIGRDRQAAYSVILRDQNIDEMEKQLDRLCLEFLVRQQPVAGHLRFAYAAIKINAELERIGDYAESIARQALKIAHLNPAPARESFIEIANFSIPMLRDAVRSFTDQSAELARSTMVVEETVDEIRDRINGELIALREQNRIPLESLTPLMTIARRFERVSDQAKNICEEVLYMCTGEYAKHRGTEVLRVLFVDEHNSCRSQMAEGIANALGQPRLVFASAGIDPKPVDPGTVKFLKERGVDISRHTSKAIDQVPNIDHYHVIVALAKEAQKVFPTPPTKTVALEWAVQDPSKVTGSPEQVRAAYEAAYVYIREHINDLAQAILGDKID
jgi:phosphate transport system protein